jgi:hypothetical protein
VVVRRGAWTLAALWLVGGAMTRGPVAEGDAGEYLLMLESLARHMTPDMRTGDIQALSLAAVSSGTPLDFTNIYAGYFRASDDRRYCYHFWAYPLVGLPARLALQTLRMDRLKALPITNAILLMLALTAILNSPRLTGAARASLFGLTLLSPVAWMVLWPHPEVFTFVGVTLSMLWCQEARYVHAISAAAVASMQNPPLVFLVGGLWLDALVAARARCPIGGRPATPWLKGSRSSPRTLLSVTLAAAPAMIPPIFYYWKFRTPSLVAREAASWHEVSLQRAGELLFDLNIGMLPYLPVTMLLFLVVVAVALAKRGRLVLINAAILLFLGLSASATTNWNSGTPGPNRYAIWMLPFVFLSVVTLRETWVSRPRRFGIAMTAAIASQALIVYMQGGLVVRANYLEHSYAAAFVLRRAPWLYNPSPEVFAARTLHRDTFAATILQEPVVYRTEAGCHKAWARPEDEEPLKAICGPLPSATVAAIRQGVAGEWRYVNF